MTENKLSVGSAAKIEDEGVAPSTSATKLGLNWGEVKFGDPFGARVSTKETGSLEPPFEILNVGDFDTVRDKMRDLAGDRPATANFELSPEPDQQLQPSIDLTPKAVRAHIATNMARNEEGQAKVDAVKANELNTLAALMITTGKGLHEDVIKDDPGYFETVLLSLQAACLDSTTKEAYQKLTPEAIRAMRAQLKNQLKDHPSASVGAEEARAEQYHSKNTCAPTAEDEAPARSYLKPVICCVVDKAEMQYSMLYKIVTQMQRDRLELGPEVSDYEVIAEAYAGYDVVDEVEAADLARSADIQTATALAVSIAEQLHAAQRKGLPITTVGGISLTQEDITSLLDRCEELSSCASAVNDYIASSSANFKRLHADPFSTPEGPIPSGNALNLGTVKDHKSVTNTSIAKSRKKQKGKEKTIEGPLPDTFDNSVEQIEQQIQDMRAFHSRIGTAPRDFSKEIKEIENELAKLKVHRAKSPGDLVPDSVGGDQGGIRVCAYDYGDRYEPDAEDIQEDTSSFDTKRKPRSRAEQRRLARQKAKDVATVDE